MGTYWFDWLLLSSHLAVGAGAEQQQVAQQLLMNHLVLGALPHQLPHLLTQHPDHLNHTQSKRCCGAAARAPHLVLQQHPVDEEGSDVLLLPVKLQDRMAVVSPRPRPSQAGPASKLTRFSSDFLTSVKLFQRESNSLLWVPLKNSRSLRI